MRVKPSERLRRPGQPEWLALLAFILLGTSHLVAGVWFGQSGTLATAVFAEMTWLGLRPWRWGGSNTNNCRYLGWAGVAALGAFALIAAWLYHWPTGS